MPAFSDPARRSGAAKSKEEADCQQACGATRNGAGSPTGDAHGTEHGAIIAGRLGKRNRDGRGPQGNRVIALKMLIGAAFAVIAGEA